MYVSDKKNRKSKQIKQGFSFGTRLFFQGVAGRGVLILWMVGHLAASLVSMH